MYHCCTQVLKASPLLRTFSDHLWAVVKTAHERDLLSVIHTHSKSKAAFSDRFPGTHFPCSLMILMQSITSYKAAKNTSPYLFYIYYDGGAEWFLFMFHFIYLFIRTLYVSLLGCGTRVVAVEGQLLQLLTQAAGQIDLGDCGGLFERAASGVRETVGGGGASSEGLLYGDSMAGERENIIPFDLYWTVLYCIVFHCTVLCCTRFIASSCVIHVKIVDIWYLRVFFLNWITIVWFLMRSIPLITSLNHCNCLYHPPSESLLLQLTSLAMEGRTGLKIFINTMYTDMLQVRYIVLTPSTAATVSTVYHVIPTSLQQWTLDLRPCSFSHICILVLCCIIWFRTWCLVPTSTQSNLTQISSITSFSLDLTYLHLTILYCRILLSSSSPAYLEHWECSVTLHCGWEKHTQHWTVRERQVLSHPISVTSCQKIYCN